mmetsp:Transcript_10795/g.24060  ORF Transcript_10795/g.24060 Transcript_10795/m.24060 type:complete len:233 (-) Transcript_10795:19-717(-)
MGQGCTCERAEWEKLTVDECCKPSQRRGTDTEKRSRERFGPQILRDATELDESDDALAAGQARDLKALESTDKHPNTSADRQAQEHRNAAAHSFKDNLKRAYLDDEDESRPPSDGKVAGRLPSVFLQLTQQRGMTTAAEGGEPDAHGSFSVRMERSADMKLGVEIASRGGTVVITNVKKDGMVHRWNVEHPENRIRAGDVILQVNGKVGPEIVDELQAEGQLMLKLLRRGGL